MSDGDAIAGVVTLLEPPRVLRFTWDMALIQWSLSATPGGCRLDLVHHGITDAHRVSEFGPGWQQFLECLERYFDDAALPRMHSAARASPSWRTPTAR
jgi:uncharacterized protein YndB with AHSA1/START domain